MAHKLKIVDTRAETHDVKHFILEKPKGYGFRPGQATSFSLPTEEFRDEERPFSFVSLKDDDQLEFLIKIYEERDGMTKALMDYGPNDEVILSDPFGAIAYQKPGLFIAAGAGITPFIAIFRQLQKDSQLEGNKLFFANKRAEDIILRDELQKMFGDDGRFILSQEEKPSCDYGRIDQEYLRNHVSDLNQHFYVCGPSPMVKNVVRVLDLLGADPERIITEDGVV